MHSTARAKTVAHMQQLLAAAGAVAACTHPETATVTATAVTTPDAAPPATAVPPPTGYMVVDPMPSPARCYGVAATLVGKAQWKQDATGLFLEITFTKAPSPPPGGGYVMPSFFDKAGTTVWGANLMNIDQRGDTLVIHARPLSGNTFMSASLAMSCSNGPGSPTNSAGTVIATLNFSAGPKAGDTVAVTLVDR